MTGRMIVVGPVARWQMTKRQLPQVDGVSFVDFADLPDQCFERDPPDLILSPLVGPTFDVLDVARLLFRMGYAGAYRAVTEGLPSPAVVLAEVAAVAPGLDFDVVSVPLRPDT